MRFSEAFLRMLKDRASIADYAGKLVQWDRRKSQIGKGDFWAPCPFHSEKTASFHVRDSQGNYKCFGCGEAGGIIDLAMKLEGLSFPEAVERIANYAGVPLPEDDTPRDDAAEKRRKRLLLLMERAQVLYAHALETPEGRNAKSYLERRGIPHEVRAQFGIGYAPGGYTWSIEKFKAQGFALDELVDAGLAYEGEDGRRSVDVFRDRVMFPIADAQGRIVAFGGRALDPEAKAKYLNSPETQIFHKSRTLYRLKEARTLAAKSKARGLVVAEGYLDVIAFERAGIGAVAPMGTALTEDQLQLVWRSGSEPVFCFDGDGAGVRAANRALDLALPHLGPERTLRVAFLPQGQDPDDVFRAQGGKALNPIVELARPAVEALFERERMLEPLDTPERKSGFKKRLRDAANRIADPETKQLYLRELLSRTDELLTHVRPPQGRPGKQQRGRPGFEPPAKPTAELKARTAGAKRHLSTENFLREAVDSPAIPLKFADWIAKLPIEDADLDAIRHALLDLIDQTDSGEVDREALTRHLSALGEERAAARISLWPKSRSGCDEAVEAEWMAFVTLDVVLPAIKEEMAALRARADQGDGEAFDRFVMLDRDARALESEARALRSTEPESRPPESRPPESRPGDRAA